MTSPLEGEATRMLAELGRGDRSAASRLWPLVYEELRRVAGGYFRRQRAGHTLQPTALVHEAFLRMIDQTQVRWNDRAHFMAVAARAMRQILINHARKRCAVRHGGGRQRLTLEEALTPVRGRELDLLVLDDALERLGEFHERMAQVVELRFFGGLTIQESAEALGVSSRTVEKDWEMARAWLSRALSEADPP